MLLESDAHVLIASRPLTKYMSETEKVRV